MPATRSSLSTAEEERTFQGIPITVENPKGSIRSGHDKEGKEWHQKMLADYGFIDDTISQGDHEPVDVYIGPDEEAPHVFVIEQLTDEGEFDEMKLVLGTETEEEALDLYLAHYPEGWKDHVGQMWPLSVDRLREMAEAHQ
jgi:hypothetical protein